MSGSYPCRVCNAGGLFLFPAITELPRVTSDCKPYAAGGQLALCEQCGTLQKPPSRDWLDDIASIYGDYSIYHQANGAEQSVPDPSTDTLRRRSSILVSRVSALFDLADGQDVLDIGCGSGVTLRAFAQAGGAFNLYGLDLDDRNLRCLRLIPGFNELFTCPVEHVPMQFDVITIVHALEHFPDPLQFLYQLRNRIRPGGIVIIQVPDAAANPYDLLVADHSMHFSAASLVQLVRRAAYDVAVVATDWIPKELTLVARANGSTPGVDQLPDLPKEKIAEYLVWLASVLAEARKLSRADHFGLFGSSIAATWVAGAIGPSVRFFIDEDPARIGNTHLGRPIIGSSDIPPEAVVYVPLLSHIAQAVAGRLRRSHGNIHIPRPLQAHPI